jgi:mercuric ion transport protein
MADTRGPEPTPNGRASREAAVCRVGITAEQAENRGMAWIIASFVICPCHLPITLWLLATLLTGTAFGAVLHGHPVLVGTVITLAWVAGTWRGLHLLRSARAHAARAKSSG